MDPAATPAAVKAATEAAAGFTPGQVWTRTAPHGEPQLQASVLFQNKEVARLEFDATTGALLPHGFRPVPPPVPGGALPVTAAPRVDRTCPLPACRSHPR